MENVGERRGMLPSSASLFSAYVSLSAFCILLQQAFYQFIPLRVRAYLSDLFKLWFTLKPPPSSDHFELIIEEGIRLDSNQIFEACHIYLCNKLRDTSHKVKVSRAPHEKTLNFKLAGGAKFSETFEGINLEWSFHYMPHSRVHPPVEHHYLRSASLPDKQSGSSEKSYFSLVFDKEHEHKVCTSYLHFVVETSKNIAREPKLVKLIDCNARYSGSMHNSRSKHSINMIHSLTFETLAMDPELKMAIVNDLDRFLRRKEFYQKVGKPWKRGYLLYGPPGTGKSCLIAAMANYLKFDIYDLQLGPHVDDRTLRDLLLCIPSQSITVVEDIDRVQGLPKREVFHSVPRRSNTLEKVRNEPQMFRAALLNFVDGLWSCCGDERLIIFTANNKGKLDPALLRPGRMDMHIHMSYLTMPAFNILAYNYLQISNHQLFGEIEKLLEAVSATPAEVAEELMMSKVADEALQSVVELLTRKQSEAENATSLELSAQEDEHGSFGEVVRA